MDFFVLSRYLLLIWIVFVPNWASAQLIDSIKSSFDHEPKILVKLDTRNSFVGTRAVRVRGVKLGANYNDVSKVGIGYHWIQPKFDKNIALDTENGTEVVVAKLRLEYLAPFYEYTFYKRKKLEVSIPVQMGIGRSYYRYKRNDRKHNLFNKPVILYEPAMAVLYKPIPWAGIGFGVGYRLMLLGNKEIDENFTSPIYVLKFNLFVSYFYNRYLKKKEVDNLEEEND